jgi:hypothetical protein
MRISHVIIIVSIICLINFSYAQQSENVRSLSVIDCPTAATLDKGSFLVALYAYSEGGILGMVDIGLTNRLMLGISYGGTNLIGVGEVKWNPQVGVNIRYRAIDEQVSFPGISVGYDGQGRGMWVDSLDRYAEKSKGLFVAASKSFRLLGSLALHGGLNYSFEREDKDKDLNGFLGIEKSINEELAVYAEYDLAMNDNTGRSIGDGKGYLNLGVKWSFQNKLFIDFLWKDIRRNNHLNKYSSREIRLSYVEYF